VENQPIPLLESLLAEAGFALTNLTERPGLLGEDAARIVWVRSYSTVGELLETWGDEQAWFVDYVGDRVSTEKTWELYLVLASEGPAGFAEVPQLEAIRADTSYTRKISIPGLATASPARVLSYLAALRPLELDVSVEVPEALGLLEQQAESEDRADVQQTLRRYRENRPLFGVSS
jgi:hypothetical protein